MAHQFDTVRPEEAGKTALQRLNRFEMYQLANAYGVQYPANATKNVMLNLLQIQYDSEAIAVGMEPANPEYLLPAGQRPERVAARGKKEVIDATPSIQWRGPAWKFCIVKGDDVLEKGLDTRDIAENALRKTNGQELPDSG